MLSNDSMAVYGMHLCMNMHHVCYRAQCSMEFYESSKVAGMINKLADSSSVYDLE